jgi:glycosyltransferase involved in cell wall biosynthesis
LRICLVYDCLYPFTVGGAERWYRNLAARLAEDGHEVTYVTLRQWGRDAPPEIPGIRVVPVGPRMSLYANGRRRIAPPLVFGAGVLGHLALHGGRYDVVHTASFPYFSVLAAAAARVIRRFRLVVDWHELWTRDYWLEYLGSVRGRLAHRLQRMCVRRRQRAFCFSRLHARRLEDEGVHDEVTVLTGQYAGALERPAVEEVEPVVVFAGRHIPEKRVPALVPAFALARERVPGLRCEIYGDGPERPEVLRLIEELGLSETVEAPGFVDADRVDRALRHALCMVLPSRREGYGLVVVESSAHGTPSVVVADPDNAAIELVDDGVNGVVAPSAAPDDLAAAIGRVHEGGRRLRESTADWFADNAQRLSLESSLAIVSRSYAGG